MTFDINTLSCQVGKLRRKAGQIEDEIASIQERIEAGPNEETIKVLSEARLKRQGQVDYLRLQIREMEQQAERQGKTPAAPPANPAQ